MVEKCYYCKIVFTAYGACPGCNKELYYLCKKCDSYFSSYEENAWHICVTDLCKVCGLIANDLIFKCFDKKRCIYNGNHENSKEKNKKMKKINKEIFYYYFNRLPIYFSDVDVNKYNIFDISDAKENKQINFNL